MNTITKQLIEDVLTLAVIVCLLAMTTIAILDATYPNVPDAMEPQATKAKVHLPSICKEYYDSSTDEWQRCMLVEKR